MNLVIKCKDCGKKWPIPTEMSEDVLVGTARIAANHKCGV